MLAAGDRSVQVHSCHGPARQIDVLREVLLGLLADDPTLEPRDIVVMCPDIETYAPLIVADFGLGETAGDSHPAHRLRVRLADRALTADQPAARCGRRIARPSPAAAPPPPEVLNLAQAAPVRARFGFTDDDLDNITDWVREVRNPVGLRQTAPQAVRARPHRPQHLAFRDRPDPDRGRDVRRFPGLAGHRAAARRRRQQPGRTGGSARRIRRPAAVTPPKPSPAPSPLTEWIDALTDGVAQLTRVDAGDAWQDGQLQREFADVLAQAGSRANTRCGCPTCAPCWPGIWPGGPTRANFRTGTLTVCTMVPMRSVPHRVVCLVGLDDGVFPRLGVVDGDDVLARRPMTGERDIRSEDRQLLLDAICAATETLVITYTGADEHTGHPRPPAVPLAELLDALDQTTGTPVRERIVTDHPLQPFDVQATSHPGALVPGQPFTFDPTALAAARGRRRRRGTEPPHFFTGPLPPPPAGDVALADLLAFFKRPGQGVLPRAGLHAAVGCRRVEDAMPVEIDNLEEWTVGDRMLRDMLRGMHPDRPPHTPSGGAAPCRRGGSAVRKAQGHPRLGAPSWPQAALRAPPGRADAYDVDIDLGGGRRLTGTVTPVFGERTVSVTYSKLGGKHVLQSWIRLVALAASSPDATGPRCASGGARAATASRRGCSARPGAASTCCETWWRSTTRADASHCRCR